MKRQLLFLTIALCFISSCEKEGTVNKLIGYWQLETEIYEGETYHYDMDDYLTVDWGDEYICTYKRLKVLPFDKND